MKKMTNNILLVAALLVLVSLVAPAVAFQGDNPMVPDAAAPPSGVRVYGEDNLGPWPGTYNCVDDPNGDCTVRTYLDYKYPFDPTVLMKDSLTFNPAKIIDSSQFPMSYGPDANEKAFYRTWYEPNHVYSKDIYHTLGVEEWMNVKGTIETETSYMLLDAQDEVPVDGKANQTYFVLPIAATSSQTGLSATENAQGDPDKSNVVKIVNISNESAMDSFWKTTDGNIKVQKTYGLRVGETVQFLDHKVTLLGLVRDPAGTYWINVKVSYAGNNVDDSQVTTVLGKFDVNNGNVAENPNAETYFKRHNEKYSKPVHPDATFYAKFETFDYWSQRAWITVGKELQTGDLFYVNAVRYEVRALEVVDTNGDGIADAFKYITLGSPLPKCGIDGLVPDDGKISSQWIDCIVPGEQIPVLPPYNARHNVIQDINVPLWAPLKHLDKWPIGDPTQTNVYPGAGSASEYFPLAERYLTMQNPPDEWLYYFRAVPIDSDRDMLPQLPTDEQNWAGPYKPAYNNFDLKHWVAYDVDERMVMDQKPLVYYYHEEDIEPRLSTNLLEVLNEKFPAPTETATAPPIEGWTKFDVQTMPDRYTEFKLPDIDDLVLHQKITQQPDFNISKPGDFLLTTSLLAKNGLGDLYEKNVNPLIPRVAFAYDVGFENVSGQPGGLVGDGLDIYVNNIDNNTVRVYGEEDLGPEVGYDSQGQYQYANYQQPFDPASIRKDSITFNPAKILWDGTEFPISADSTNADLKKYLRLWYEPNHTYTKPDYRTLGTDEWLNVKGTIELETTYLLTDRQDELPLSGPVNTTYFPFPIVSIPSQNGLGGFENPVSRGSDTPSPDRKNVVRLVNITGTTAPFNKTVDASIEIEKTYRMRPGDTIQFLTHKLKLTTVLVGPGNQTQAQVVVDYTGNNAFGSDSTNSNAVLTNVNSWFDRHNSQFTAPSQPGTVWYARIDSYDQWGQVAEITVGSQLQSGETFYVNYVRYDIGAIEVIDTTGDGVADEFKYITIKTPLPKCDDNTVILNDDGKPGLSSQQIKCYEPGEVLPINPPFNGPHTIVDDINVPLWAPLKHMDKWPLGDKNSSNVFPFDMYNSEYFPNAERYLTMQYPPATWLHYFRAVPIDTDRDMRPSMPTDEQIWDGPYYPCFNGVLGATVQDIGTQQYRCFDPTGWIAYDVDERYVHDLPALAIKYVAEKIEPRYSTNLLEILDETPQRGAAPFENWTKFDIQTLPDQYTEFQLPEIPDLQVKQKISQQPDFVQILDGDYLVTTSFLAKNSLFTISAIIGDALFDHDTQFSVLQSLPHYIPRYAFSYDAANGRGLYVNEQPGQFPPLPNFPPTPTFVVTPGSADALQLFTADATGTEDREAEDYPVTLHWDWGDGMTDTQVVDHKHDAIPTISHSYTMRGTKTITLVACDTKACSGPATNQVTVNNDGFVLNLKQGWNQISFPVIGASRHPFDIFGEAVTLYWYDPVLGWQALNPVADNVVDGNGYFVYLNSDKTVTITGTAVTRTRAQLIAGLAPGLFNLVGPGSTSIDMTGTPYTGAWLNPASHTYMLTRNLDPGKGYWMVG